MGKHKRCLTIAEGRELNQKMAQELVRAAVRAGWDARIVKTVGVLDIVENRLDDVFSDYVLWRGLVKNNLYESERIIAYLNATNRVTINTHVVGGLSCTSNKFFQHGVLTLDKDLAQHILPMYQAVSRNRVQSLLNLGKITYPFCLKPQQGTRGEGIILVRSEKDIPEHLAGMLIEPYIKSTYDWRVFVLGGKALGAMRKIGNTKDEADFEAKSGGRQRFGEHDPEILKEICKLAEKAAVVSGLDYTGIDLIRDDKTGKFYVLETNFAGGWQNGFLQATGVNVPDEIVKYFEKKYREREEK